MSAIIRREVFAGPTKDAEGVEREGALEAFALPGGNYVVALNRPAVLTDSGRIEAPGALRFPVLTIGSPRGRCIAGQSQDSGATWEWVDADTRWSDRGPNAGERPCVYTPEGTLIIEPGGQDHPTEGWAAINPDGFPQRIVRYAEVLDIHELTVLWPAGSFFPLYVGQSSIDGIEIQFDEKRYQAEPGDTHTIWAVLQGNILALATRKLAQNETVLLWIDITRLAELPPAPVKQPPITPTKPPITPDPPKENPVDDLKFPFPDGYNPRPALEANRAKFRTPIMVEGQYDDRPAHLISACQIVGHGAGLLKKNGGTYTTLPDGTRVSQDWMEFPNGTALDFIGDGENKAAIGWGEAKPSQGERVDVSQWFSDGPVKPPIEPPKPDGLEARVAKLEALMEGVKQSLADGADVNAEQWEAIRAIKPGAAFDPAAYQVVVKGGTSRVFAHAHDVNFTAEIEKR